MTMYSKKLAEYWGFLKSLNDQAEYGFIVPFEGVFSGAGQTIQVQYQVPSGYNFFAYQLMGFCEFTPSDMGAATWAADAAANWPHLVQCQININPPNVDLFDTTWVTLAQIIGELDSPKEPFTLPHPWRVVPHAIITAVFQNRAGFTTGRVGLALAGELITQEVLEHAAGARL